MVYLGVLAGLVILVAAGDALVRGAVGLSGKLGIPALIVSLTVVAFGTSAPELMISIKAVLDNAPGIAIGNVIGSNTANILLVLGVPAAFVGMGHSQSDTRKSFAMMMAASLLFVGLAFGGVFGWIQGLILLAGLAGMILYQVLAARGHMANGNGEETEEWAQSNRMIAGLLAAGLIGLPIGANLFVENAVVIARMFNISETVIGLTLVAVGTSLPELATTIMAALRRNADVALGNVIGSNMFNVLGILGVASLVGPIPVPDEILNFDIWVMLGASALLFPFVFLGWTLARFWGLILSGLYLTYLAVILA